MENQRYLKEVVFVGCFTLFAIVALLMGLPGADGDSCSTYNVITRLAQSFTYTLSRSPGQPFLDYCNLIGWTAGGDIGAQVWFVIVSALGVTSLYFLTREANGSSPLAAALTLGLHPLFIAHVGGLGDFAVSLSFLTMSLLAAMLLKPVWAGLALAFAIGCRLAFCIYLVPVMVLAAMAYKEHGVPSGKALHKAALAGIIAVLLSAALYGPLFCFWGRKLLLTLPMQSIFRFHLPALAYKLFIDFGLIFWLVIGGVIIQILFSRSRQTLTKFPSGLDWAAFLLIIINVSMLFRVPTKPEIALPILLGCIVLIQRWASRKWAFALLSASVLVGIFNVSPYNSREDRYIWHFTRGGYSQALLEADMNRLTIRAVRDFLASRSNQTILVTRCSWTEAQADNSDLISILNYRGIPGLKVFAFGHIGKEKVAVHFQEPKLGELLRVVNSTTTDNQIEMVYETFLYGWMKRWSHIDLAHFGQGIVLQRDPLSDLWRSCGRANPGLATP